MKTTRAVVVGSGPNGLAAAITLARQGVDVTVFEATDVIGGGLSSGERTVPGVLHDDYAAIVPTALASPFMQSLDLAAHGVEWAWPEIDLAHPIDSGRACSPARSMTPSITWVPTGEPGDGRHRDVRPDPRRGRRHPRRCAPGASSTRVQELSSRRRGVQGGPGSGARRARRKEFCRAAGTVHVCGSFDDVVAAERATAAGRMPDRPFVVVAQQYLMDPGRSAGDVHPLYAYAHVPHGYSGDGTAAILDQIERFAPGFRERIVGMHVRTPGSFTRSTRTSSAGRQWRRNGPAAVHHSAPVVN